MKQLFLWMMALFVLTSCFWSTDDSSSVDTPIATGATQELTPPAELNDENATDIEATSTWSELSAGASQSLETQSEINSSTWWIDLSDEEVLDIKDILSNAESDIDAIYDTIELE